jgi:ribosome-interacting GTPase 1
VIENELEGFGIRINKKPPNIVFKKKDKGGIAITANINQVVNGGVTSDGDIG